jgi:D-aminoacyl-tRNA deacylase
VRALIQRVSRASVEVAGEPVARIGPGLLVLVAAGRDDGQADVRWLASKIARLRIFADADGRMNRSLTDVAGEALVVSQFTLYADASRGNRPGFVDAAPPDEGAWLVEAFAGELERLGVPVARGRFGAHMQVELVNDGPVTIWLESPAPGR